MIDTALAHAPVPSDTPSIPNAGLDKAKLQRKVRGMYEKRQSWVKRWKSIRDYQLPYIGEFENTADETNPARRKDRNILEGVAWSACQKFAAGIMSGLTPPSRQWFKLGFKNLDTSGNVDIQKILDERQAILESVMHGSNFYNAIHSVYLELPFGQCPMPIFYDPQHGIRCVPLTIGTYALEVDGYGKVSSIARRFELTLEQLVGEFGMDALPKSLQMQAKNGNWDNAKKHKVTWLVEPNNSFRPGYVSKINMPWRSVYWLENSSADEFLYVGGFEEAAVPVARFLVNGLEPYAKGPGWFAEGDSKALQVMKKDYLSALELSVKPPMGGPASLMNNGGINLIPGGFTPVEDANMGQSVRPLFQVQLDLAHTAEEIQRTEERIKDAYAVNLFVMLDQLQHGQMTAQEVRERTNEKLQQLGPVVERLQDEFLTTVIERIYGILDRAGAFPPVDPDMQRILANEEVKIDYISPLAQAQKMSGLTVIEQGLAQAAQMAQLWPDTLKVIDGEATIREYLDRLGAPANMMRSIEQVEAMKQAEQEAIAQQQAMEQEQMAMQQVAPLAQAAKNLSDAATDGNPAMNQWLGLGGV